MTQLLPIVAVVIAAVASVPVSSSGAVSGGHHGRARAVAAAKAVLADAPTIDSATPSATSPVRRLRHAPEHAAYSQLVMRAHWWTIDEPASVVYRDFKADVPAGYREAGWGGGGGPRRRDVMYSVDYQPKSSPSNMAYEQLIVAVTPTGKDTAAIGAYGQAAPRPHRPASEHVPTPVHTTIVSRVRSEADKHPRQRTLHGKQARALVHDFNALLVSAPGTTSCGADYGQSDSVSFHSHGDVWVASRGACPEIAVVRDGKALPSLDSTAAFSHDLSAALRRR